MVGFLGIEIMGKVDLRSFHGGDCLVVLVVLGA